MQTRSSVARVVLAIGLSSSVSQAAPSAPSASSSAPPAAPTAPGAPAPAAGKATPKPAAAPAASSAASGAPAPAASTSAPAAPPAPGAGSSAPASSPAPPASAAAPAAEPAGAPSSAPPSPEGPPPQYYVEPQRPYAAPPEGVYEPPPPEPPIYEPPPPQPPDQRAPRTAFWVGARLSAFVPFGSLWIDGFNGPSGIYYRRRTFSAYASPGPAGELDVGVRLARRYLVFALYEHASLGTGNLDADSFGGQERGATNLYGVGLRFSTEPSSVGFSLEIALGYRDFRAYWSDGTRLTMTDGLLDARIGLGADIRLTRSFSLSPMIVLGGGSFGSGRFTGSTGNHDVQTPNDLTGEYGTLALQLGGHFDVY